MEPKHISELTTGEVFDVDLESWVASQGGALETRYPFRCKSITVVKDPIKKPIREIVIIFYDLCRKGIKIDTDQTLVPGNIGFVRGTIVLKRIYKSTNPVDDCNNSFHKLRHFIKHTFFSPDEQKDLPADMREWLSTMSSNACGKQELLQDHFALMNERARRNFIIHWVDIRGQLDPTQLLSYRWICRQLPHGWRRKVRANKVMNRVYYRGRDQGGYHHWDITCQMNFLRNFLVHCTEHSRLSKDRRLPLLFVYDNGLDMLLSEFESVIALIPELLDGENLLELFRPSQYF